MNVAGLLEEQVRLRPSAWAIIEGRDNKLTTFAELGAAGNAAAASFAAARLRPGDAVLVFHPMTTDLYVVLAGMLHAGLVAMFLDPANGMRHIEQCCRRVQPAAFFASPRGHSLRLISPALRAIPHKFAAVALPGTKQLEHGAARPAWSRGRRPTQP